MVDFDEVATKALGLLREGAVQAADEVLNAALYKHRADLAAAAGAVPPPPPPRAANAVLLELLNAMVGLFGVPPKLENLVKELEQVL